MVLKYIYDNVYEKYKYDYIVNDFLKRTDFNDCLRLKLNSNTTIFDEYKNPIEGIDNYSYGHFIIELEGLWLNEDNIWFQWNLLQAKIKTPTYLSEYSFIDEIHEKEHPKKEDKYDKMLKMGVPQEAVNRQKAIDGKIPLPPPPPNLINMKNKSHSVPKINAADLRNVVLKKGKPLTKPKPKKISNHFEPPSLEELQITLSKLKNIK